MPALDTLIGKPFVFTKDNKKRRIGEIVRADVRGDSIYLQFKVTDKDIAELLGIEVDGTITAAGFEELSSGYVPQGT